LNNFPTILKPPVVKKSWQKEALLNELKKENGDRGRRAGVPPENQIQSFSSPARQLKLITEICRSPSSNRFKDCSLDRVKEPATNQPTKMDSVPRDNSASLLNLTSIKEQKQNKYSHVSLPPYSLHVPSSSYLKKSK